MGSLGYGDCAYYGYVGRTKDTEHPWWSKVVAYSVIGNSRFPALGYGPHAISRSTPSDVPGYAYWTSNTCRFKSAEIESYCGPNHVSRTRPAWPPSCVVMNQTIVAPGPPDVMRGYGSAMSVYPAVGPTPYAAHFLAEQAADPRKSYEEFPYVFASSSPGSAHASRPSYYIDIRGPALP